MVCSSVPAAIYAIPPSHPAYNVTYVTVQGSTTTTVTYAQTSGYSGEYVASTGVLMFGAGMLVGVLLAEDEVYYHYPPYPSYYSYGCAATYHWGYGGFYGATWVAYGPYGGAGHTAAYNPYTGGYFANTRVNTPYGSAGRTVAYNPATGNAVRAGYQSTGLGSAAAVQTSKGGGGVAWNTDAGKGGIGKSASGNIYAGRDDVVYKKDTDGNWWKNSGNGWEDVPDPLKKGNKQGGVGLGQQTRPSETVPTGGSWSQTRQSLEWQAQSRSWGNQQYQRAQTWRGAGGYAGGGPAGRSGGAGRGGSRR